VTHQESTNSRRQHDNDKDRAYCKDCRASSLEVILVRRRAERREVQALAWVHVDQSRIEQEPTDNKVVVRCQGWLTDQGRYDHSVRIFLQQYIGR